MGCLSLYEYLISVTVISALLGLVSYLSYPGVSEKAVRFAVSVLLVYTSMTPVLSFVSRLSDGGELDFIEEIREQAEDGFSNEQGEYLSVAEDAIKKGISKLIFTEYGVAEENIKIYLRGFNFEEMRADNIKIVLQAGGALADYRGIEELVNSLGIGECEVNIEFG